MNLEGIVEKQNENCDYISHIYNLKFTCSLVNIYHIFTELHVNFKVFKNKILEMHYFKTVLSMIRNLL